MAKISLSYYTFRIQDNSNTSKAKEPKYFTLGNINGKSLETYLYDYFYTTAKKYENDKQNERLFRTVNFDVQEYLVDKELYYKSITAIVKTGEYGVEAEIIDSEDTSKTKTMSSSEAPVMPFGFAIYFNPQKDTAVLITQSLGRNGITTVIKKHLTTLFKSINPDWCVEIKNVIPHNLLKKLLENDKIKSIRIETYKDNNYALEDEYGEQTTLQTSQKTSIIKKPIISNKNFLFDMFVKHKKISKVSGLTSDDEVIDNIIVDFSNKSLNYNAYYSTRITEDITKHFKDENGIPSLKLFSVIDESVIEYLNALKIIVPIENPQTEKNKLKYFYIDSKDDVIEEHITNAN